MIGTTTASRPERWTAREVGVYDGGIKTFALVDHAGRERALGTEEEILQLAASDALLAACKALAERYGPASGYVGEQAAELLAAEAAIARAEAPR